MNRSTTKLLVLLALGLFAFTYWSERNLRKQVVTAEERRRILPGFHAESVTSLELIIPTNQVIRVERASDNWQMTFPVRYPAQATIIENFLKAFEVIRESTFISARELVEQRGGMASFGFDAPAATVVIQQGPNRTELRFASAGVESKRAYVQVVGSEGVHVIDGTVLDLIPTAAANWREHALLSASSGAINRLSVRRGARTIEFEFDATNQLWRVTKPISARADGHRIIELIRQIQAASVFRFVLDNPDGDLESYGLRPADLALTLGKGTNDLFALQFGNSPTNLPLGIHALRSAQTNVVIIPKVISDAVGALFTDFRDTKLAGFPAPAVERIEISGTEPISLARQGTNQWRSLTQTNLPVDSGLVRDFLTNLGNLEVVEFVKDSVTDYATYGLAKGTQKYALLGASTNTSGTPTNPVLYQVEFGGMQMDRINARRADEPFVYAIRLGDYQYLPRYSWQLRDRQLFNFASTNVTSVEVIQPGGHTNVFTRNADRTWSDAKGPFQVVESAAIEENLVRLGQTKSELWTARGPGALPVYGLDEAAGIIFRVSLNGDRKSSLEIRFSLKLSPWRRPYAATQLEGEWMVCEFPPAMYTNLMEHFILRPGAR